MEKKYENLIKKIIKKSNPVILEFGANRGRCARVFLRNFKNISLYCFEPDPRVAKQFLSRIKKDRLNGRCHFFEYAVSDKDGESYFYLSKRKKNIRKHISGEDSSSSLKEPLEILNIAPNLVFDKKIMVKTISLDSWIKDKNIEVIDLIWADIQGSEGDMIKGGIKTFERTRYVIMEYCETELYKGQFLLKDILNSLPYFRILKKYCWDEKNKIGDILLKNIKLD